MLSLNKTLKKKKRTCSVSIVRWCQSHSMLLVLIRKSRCQTVRYETPVYSRRYPICSDMQLLILESTLYHSYYKTCNIFKYQTHVSFFFFFNILPTSKKEHNTKSPPTNSILMIFYTPPHIFISPLLFYHQTRRYVPINIIMTYNVRVKNHGEW